jgi:hypothetical protein
MAAPVATERVTPTAKKMDDGYKTLITFAANPSIEFWEKTVTPPGVDGGDPLDTTTMHSTRWRTRAPRALITLGEVKATVEWNPSLYVSILALINKKDTVTIRFPDQSTLAFFGFLRLFDPGDLAEGGEPTASITVTPTNADPVTGAEQAPVYTAPPPGAAPMIPEGGMQIVPEPGPEDAVVVAEE